MRNICGNVQGTEKGRERKILFPYGLSSDSLKVTTHVGGT